MDNAVKFYKDVLHFDNMHVEAIACIATHHFYTDQPEVALKFYRLVSVCVCVCVHAWVWVPVHMYSYVRVCPHTGVELMHYGWCQLLIRY